MAYDKVEKRTSQATLELLDQVASPNLIRALMKANPGIEEFIPKKPKITLFDLNFAKVSYISLLRNDPRFTKVLADMTAKAIDYTETRRDAWLEQQEEQFERLMSVIKEVKITIVNAGAESEVRDNGTKDL